MSSYKECLYCGKILDLNSTNKFCSRVCYHKRRIGSHWSEEVKHKIALGNTKPCTIEKKFLISQAKLSPVLTDKEILEIEKIIKIYIWVSNPKIIIKNAKLSRHLTKCNVFKVIEMIKRIRHNSNYFFSIKIQNWDIDKMNSFLKEAVYLEWDKLIKKYDITKREFHHLLRFFNIKNYVYKQHNFHNSKLEQKFDSFLKEHNIEYRREVYMKHRLYRADFYIEKNNYKIFIELNGDYWHGNPDIFSEDQLNNQQKIKVKIDIEKRKLCKKNNWILIEIWESDLYNKYEMITKKFLDIINEETFNERHFDSRFF